MDYVFGVVMRTPDSLALLFEYGILDEVLRPLMSGKEAQIFLVVSQGNLCVAKVYKDAQNRSFKNRSEYTEGRKTRNSRDQRAMSKRSSYGKSQDEAAWKSTEVDMIRRLSAAGVRVPTPHHFVEGVLLMELVADAEGNPAPRLGDLPFTPDQARTMFEQLVREVQRMLCAGVVHGDLSSFNVLVGADGPVIIDFPQSVDSAANANARRLLLRDMENLHEFQRRFVPGVRRLPYGEEMWDLYQQNLLTPETRLTGKYRAARGPVSLHGVLDLIQDANFDERKRRADKGIKGGERIPDQPPGQAPAGRPTGPQAPSAGPPRTSQAARPKAPETDRTLARPPAAQDAPPRGPQVDHGGQARAPQQPREAQPPRAPQQPREARPATPPRNRPGQSRQGQSQHAPPHARDQRPPQQGQAPPSAPQQRGPRPQAQHPRDPRPQGQGQGQGRDQRAAPPRDQPAPQPARPARGPDRPRDQQAPQQDRPTRDPDRPRDPRPAAPEHPRGQQPRAPQDAQAPWVPQRARRTDGGRPPPEPGHNPGQTPAPNAVPPRNARKAEPEVYVVRKRPPPNE